MHRQGWYLNSQKTTCLSVLELHFGKRQTAPTLCSGEGCDLLIAAS
jgi:hypothetical protein